MKYIAFRNFADLGYNEAEIKALAAEYEVEDGPNDDGEMFMRQVFLQIEFQARILTIMRHGLAMVAPCHRICH